jgi:coenzyme PQQ biosynthesis protein PqqD
MSENFELVPQPSASHALPQPAPHIWEGLVDGNLVLFDLNRDYVHVLNATASFVWALCDGAHTVAEIIASLAEQYPAHREQIASDVLDTLERFAAEHLVSP